MALIYVLCLALAASVSSVASIQDDETWTRYTYDLLAIYNGVYDTEQQYQENSSHAYIQFLIRPVLISGISERPVWYTESAIDGTVLQAQLSIISQVRGDNIYLTIYNVSAALGLRFQEFDVSTLSSYTIADLEPRTSGCVAVFKRLAKASYVGYWPDCSVNIRGKFIIYGEAVTCDKVGSVIPPTVEGIFNVEPYVFRRRGDRYQVPGLPDYYDALCVPQPRNCP